MPVLSPSSSNPSRQSKVATSPGLGLVGTSTKCPLQGGSSVGHSRITIHNQLIFGIYNIKTQFATYVFHFRRFTYMKCLTLAFA